MVEATAVTSKETGSQGLHERPLDLTIRDFLATRERPACALRVLDTDLAFTRYSLAPFTFESVEALTSLGIKTVSDLLSLSVGELKEFGVDQRTIGAAVKTAEKFLEFFKVIPDARLAGIILGQAVGETEPEMEVTISRAVRIVLAELTRDQAKALSLFYGLNDWNPRTITEIAKELGWTKPQVKRVLATAIGLLQKPKARKLFQESLKLNGQP